MRPSQRLSLGALQRAPKIQKKERTKKRAAQNYLEKFNSKFTWENTDACNFTDAEVPDMYIFGKRTKKTSSVEYIVAASSESDIFGYVKKNSSRKKSFV